MSMAFLAIASAAVQMLGTYQQGRAQSEQYEAAARASEYNAIVARQRSTTALQVFGEREEAQRRKARAILGQQRASLAQAGIGSGGSALDVERQSEVMAELDALNIRYEGQLESIGLLQQAALDDMRSSAARRSAKNARTGSYIGMLGNALSGVGGYIKATQ